MRIAVAADEDTGVARAVLDGLRARGHEVAAHGALVPRRTRRLGLGVGVRGARRGRRRG